MYFFVYFVFKLIFMNNKFYIYIYVNVSVGCNKDLEESRNSRILAIVTK